MFVYLYLKTKEFNFVKNIPIIALKNF